MDILGKRSAKSYILSPQETGLTSEDGFLTGEVKAKNRNNVQISPLNSKTPERLEETKEQHPKHQASPDLVPQP